MDPLLQDNTNGQNFNSYSYVLNNPFKYTDPTGYVYQGFVASYYGGGRSATGDGFNGGEWVQQYQDFKDGVRRSMRDEDWYTGSQGGDGGGFTERIFMKAVMINGKKGNSITPLSGIAGLQASMGDFTPYYQQGDRYSNSNTPMEAAISFGLTAAAADGPYPVGDAIGVAAVLGTAAYVYYGVLADKMAREIDRILTRSPGPDGYQYALIATRNGYYNNVRGGLTYLHVGDVWKYGETTSSNRYSESNLQAMGLAMQRQFLGTQIQIKVQEKVMIYGYFFQNGTLPPGNKIFR